VNTGAFGEKTAVQLQHRHHYLLTAMKHSSDAADIAFFQTRSRGGSHSVFSCDEDCRIDDIARNATHAGRVPLPAWQDAANTGAFGEKTAAQLQNRHHYRLTVMKHSSDAADIAFVQTRSRGASSIFSCDEDCRIDDIARHPTHAITVPLPAWQDAVNTGAFGEKTAVQLQNRHQSLMTMMRRSSDAADIAFFEAKVEARNKNTTEKRDEAQAKKVWKKRTKEEKRKIIDAGDLAFIEACQRSKNKQKI
jgi:hypothetical protein